MNTFKKNLYFYIYYYFLFFSIINNSTSNIFNSTTETSQNTNINKMKNSYKTNNTDYTFCIPTDKNPKEKNHKIYNMKIISHLGCEKKNLLSKKKEKQKLPNYTVSIKRLENTFIKPIRKEYKSKHINSLDVKNNIKKLKNEILDNYKEIDIIKKNRSFINTDSKKNVTVLLTEKVKSQIDSVSIANVKDDIYKLMKEIKKTKNKG